MGVAEISKNAAETVEAIHVETLTRLIDLTEEFKAGGASISSSQLCDAGYFCRRVERWADEMRKEAKARAEMIAREIAVRAARLVVESPDAETTVRGTHAIGIPDVKTAAAIPKVGSPEYAMLCDWLGIPAEAYETGAIRFHFNTVAQIVSDRAAAGQDAPPGITKTYSMFTCTFKARTTRVR